MLYFERVNKIANICIVIFVLLFVMTIVSFFKSDFPEILKYNYTNDLRGAMFTLILFITSIFSLASGIILKYIAIDANKEIKLLEQRTKNI